MEIHLPPPPSAPIYRFMIKTLRGRLCWVGSGLTSDRGLVTSEQRPLTVAAFPPQSAGLHGGF